MKKLILTVIISLIIFSTFSYANSDMASELLEQINEVENTLQKDNDLLRLRIKNLESRLSKISTDLATAQSLKEDIESKYKDILRKEVSISSIGENINENKITIASLKSEINNLKTEQVKIEGKIDSSQKIVTWVTLIVSVVVVLIGAFFSRTFIELYSNYRVVCSHFPNVQGKELPINKV
ncbi:hypothetical protein [Vibrio nitrifigilis]|uniref:Uncharacterized protein n=1 Tax=Vibrio nitrifigilis TaxID=2789781 RepID=A0ABS0GJK8_9VIBR|nr:hypothetical protein [Vibrio nitrifigilis]MBF9002485.1 hypothetical protein [Vibrio nitrifigilis]